MGADFVVICGMRTGSSMLCSALNEHPDVTCYGEILRIRDYNLGIPNINNYLDSLRTDGKKLGFKLLYSQMWTNDPQNATTIKEILNCKSIHLVRSNLFELYTSYLTARSTKIWNTIDNGPELDRYFKKHTVEASIAYNNKPLYFVQEAFDDFCVEYVSKVNRMASIYINSLILDYDEISSRYAEILNHLGLEPDSFRPTTVKLRHSDPASAYINRHEVTPPCVRLDCGGR